LHGHQGCFLTLRRLNHQLRPQSLTFKFYGTYGGPFPDTNESEDMIFFNLTRCLIGIITLWMFKNKQSKLNLLKITRIAPFTALKNGGVASRQP